MKIGWLVYSKYYGDDNELWSEDVEFYSIKPDYYSGKLVQIVYAEIEDAN